MLLKALDNEKELLNSIAQGNQNSYRIIFNHYWDQIYSTAFAFTKSAEVSKDLAQDVFAHIWIKREKLIEVNKFESFLYVTARNLILDMLRKKVFTEDNEEYLKKYFEESSHNPERQLELKELEEKIHQAINLLPPQQQTAFRLSRFSGLSHEEIARQMGVSKQTIKSYIVRAIVNLREFIKEQPGISFILFFILTCLKKNF